MNNVLKCDAVKRLSEAYFSLLVFAIGIVALSQLTNIDLQIADYYFDSQQQVFIWKNSWFAKQFMHVYVKDVILLFALIGMGFIVIDKLRNFTFIDAWTRVRLRFVAIAAVLIPTIISGVKQASALHCPWDEQRYGGSAPYFRLLDVIPPNIEAGHCFPAGHASTGLWLAAFCVFWLPHRPRMALMIFLAGLGVGFVLGWVQQMRGAHFLSHTLTSMWIASAILLLMLTIGQPFLNHRQHRHTR